MNTETTATPPEAVASNIQAIDFSSESKQLYRKIAKLPKPLRDLINSSIDDGLSAKEIIQKLEASTNPPLPYPISEANISRWKTTGYQHYLAHQDHLDSIQASREAALEMAAGNNLSLPQATLQVIAGQCFEILADFSPAAVKQKLAEDPLKYTSFLHVFARLTREIVHLEKFQEARAAAQTEKSDPNRDLQAEAAEFWTRHTKALFNHKDPHRIKTENPKTIPPQSAAVPSLDPKETASSRSPVANNNPEGIASSSPGLRGTSYPGLEASKIHNPEGVAPAFSIENLAAPSTVSHDSHPSHVSHPSHSSHESRVTHHEPVSAIENLKSKIKNPPEHCLECRHPLPPLTPEAKRPNERCDHCNILLPPPGTCTRTSSDKCHHCGATLPHRLPSGRRPKPTCHNCGAGLGRELDEDIKKYAEE